MKISTFNANSVRARLPIVIDWLSANRPDVLCIQETKVVDEDFPSEAFESIGYHINFRGQKSYNGVATASLEPPRLCRFGLDDGLPPDDSRLMHVQIGSVHIVNTYVPQGRSTDHEMYAYKLEWFARLRRYFERHFSTRKRVVWLGDLNVAPLPMDIHNSEKQAEHVCYHVDVRNAFADTVSWGFTDALRLHHPEPGLYTFFDYRTINAVKRNMGWLIDHILLTPPMARQCTNAWIDVEPRLRDRPSDHTFLTAEFDL